MSDLRAPAGPQTAGPQTTGQQAAGQVSGLRRQALAASVALVLEYVLGVIVNLYVTVPAADRGAGIGPAIGRAVANGPAALAIHAVLGLLLVVAAVALVVRSITARLRLVSAASVVALLCVAGAAASGASFVGSGTAGASLGMAVLTGAALLCYLAILFALPESQGRGPGSRPGNPRRAGLAAALDRPGRGSDQHTSIR